VGAPRPADTMIKIPATRDSRRSDVSLLTAST
jgi:hypothetical protein